MSLIEEALRKAQETPHVPAPRSLERPSERQASAVVVEEPLPSLRPAPQARALSEAPASPPAIPLASGVGLLLVGMLGWFWWGHRTAPHPTRSTRTPSAAPSPTPAPFPGFRRTPPFQLTGVVGGSGEPLAIINGQIVKVGERVSGATLLEVGSNNARLRWEDQELVLKTSP